MAGDVPGTDQESPARPGAGAQLALYRRYRPATFSEVKGQEHVTEPLRQALRNGRVHHAYLFSGPRGCGKTSSARILARSLNCEQGPTPDPCGKCESCIALAPTGPGSIDVIEIDAASHGGVDDARDLRERAFYAPVSGRFKIYIIDEAHMVTREGFNALLKLVEEPPPHLKFVFATTEPEKVIATIRSRTHHYPFRLVPPAVLRELLEQILAAEGVSFDPAVLPLVVRAGAGSVRDSLSVLDQLVAGSAEAGLTYERTVALLGYTDDSLLDETVDAFAAGDGAAVFGTVGRVMEGGHDPRRFAADLLDRLRDLIVLAAVPGAGETGLLDVPADRLERMSEQAGRLGQAELTRAAAIISDGLIQMRGATAPRLLLELMCAQVLLPSASTGEKALLARVERLERRLEQPGREQPGPGPADDRPAAGGRRPAAGKQAAAREEPAPPAARKAARPAGADTGRGNRPADPGPPPAAREAAQPPAGEAGRKQGSQPPAAEAGGEPDRPPPAQRPAGPVDADAVRQRWPEILDAVKGERRVAWILLSNASVHTVEDGVLTVGFAREGEAKGFAASGYDKDLMRVLRERLGTPLKVKTIAGVLPGGRSPEGPPPGRQETGPARASGTGPGGPPAGQDAGPGPAAQAASPPPAGRSRQARQQRQAPSQARPSAEEEWPQEPDDAAGAQAPGAGLSGMDLIRQQLGGQIIEELED